MRLIEGGSFSMGSNRQFEEFVAEAGYITTAELAPLTEDADADPSMLQPGSAVFQPFDTGGAWWHYSAGANWRCPEGPGSTITERSDHPVVHISFEDATTYANWCGKTLPTEAEWEAARGNFHAAQFGWGDVREPEGKVMANCWIGRFPWERFGGCKAPFTAPVGSCLPNGFGLFDMIGNVWVWTSYHFSISDQRVDCCSRGKIYCLRPLGCSRADHFCAPETIASDIDQPHATLKSPNQHPATWGFGV
jgi:formylglycine-generating enzyme required for sulfatase activity